jgi:hypothetical protein
MATLQDLNTKYKPLIDAQIATVQQTIADSKTAKTAVRVAQDALAALQADYASKKTKIITYEKALAEQAILAPILADVPGI